MRSDRLDETGLNRSLLRKTGFWVAVGTVASVVLAVVGLIRDIVDTESPEPGVTFETISDTNVLDLRRPLQDLSIAFRGQDVQERNLNLRIMTINVANSGEVTILPSHFDNEDDWGITFEDGEMIEARLVNANSDYLRSKINLQHLRGDTVVFPKVIFEPGAFFYY